MRLQSTLIIGLGLISVAVCVTLASSKNLSKSAKHMDHNISDSTLTDYEQLSQDLVRMSVDNPEQAVAELELAIKASQDLRNNCHGAMHQIGINAYNKLGFTDAMLQQSAVCGSGYIHGVIMGQFGISHSTDVDLGTICQDTPTESCYHGIGHGAMVLFGNDIDRSLQACDTYTQPFQRDCYDGVFMHVYDNEENGLDEDINTEINKLQLCGTLDDLYQPNCYFYQPRMYAEVSPQNIIDQCIANTNDKYLADCAIGAGHTQMKYTIDNPNNSLEFCKDFPNELQSDCRLGALMYYYFDRSTASLTAQESTADALCQPFKPEYRNECQNRYSALYGVI